ncbi:hypothetical protein PoMZ_07830 [Pyricularia oryzae]|uniref:Uncharacterized protein n=1 Tax=Pyricularia oryzae TaxID=318829 RepID=A0A4P7NG38_PYROR|nr:hypothetical protein PoMZ_07830 [Pyricularia oryzae]
MSYWQRVRESRRLTESVMKPIPAMQIVLTWYHPNGARSISARASRRRSARSSMWANWLLKFLKAALPPAVKLLALTAAMRSASGVVTTPSDAIAEKNQSKTD